MRLKYWFPPVLKVFLHECMSLCSVMRGNRDRLPFLFQDFEWILLKSYDYD